ncbi:hypothetical protein QBC32DRAFT_338091 [Pseudoneurospora amorphoporcata]|uniref:Uncharacterized protein n=1 Tax=Pseudoneurospora amorphoporcata TaxID=241081 RepID=A0AAN6SGS0_9PEZI|nr:hypothetical protein QBC32DRAFT_338091 [Pseudoneurospora amorphoporcata]
MPSHQGRSDTDFLATVAVPADGVMPTREEMQANFERTYPVSSSNIDSDSNSEATSATDSESNSDDHVHSDNDSRGVRREREKEAEEEEEEQSLEGFLNKLCAEVWQEEQKQKREQEELDREIEEQEKLVEQLEQGIVEQFGDEYAEEMARWERKRKAAEDEKAGKLGPMVKRRKGDRGCYLLAMKRFGRIWLWFCFLVGSSGL